MIFTPITIHFKHRLLSILILFSVFASFVLSSCKGCGSPPPTPHKLEMERLKQELKKQKSTPVRKKLNLKKDKYDEQTVVTAIPYMPLHLNPFLQIDEWGYRISMNNIYEALVKRDPSTGKIISDLATSWDVSPNGKIYYFNLRKGVRWQDGRPFSSEDVRFTFALLTMPKLKKGSFISDINYSLARIDKLGNYGIRITLTEPNIYFMQLLSELPILPAHKFYRGVKTTGYASLHPVGTGPYRLYDIIPGDSIILERNEYYWGKTPYVQRIVFKKIPDPSKVLVGIRRKKIDIIPKMSPIHYPEQITQSIAKDYRLYRFVPPIFTYMVWNTRSSMLKDFRVRRALTMLINTDSIIKTVFKNLAVPCYGPYWRPSGLGDHKLKRWPYDPQKAKELLDEAGWQDHDGDGIRDYKGKPMNIVVLMPVDARQGRLVLENIKHTYFSAGIKLTIVPTDWKLLAKHLRKRRFSAAFLTWRGRPYEDFSPLFHSAGKYNYGLVYNNLIDKLLSSMRRSRSLKNLKTASAKLEDMLNVYLPIAFLYRPVWMSVVHRRFANVYSGFNGFNYSTFTKNKNYKSKK